MSRALARVRWFGVRVEVSRCGFSRNKVIRTRSRGGRREDREHEKRLYAAVLEAFGVGPWVRVTGVTASSPATRAPRFGIRPNVAGRSKWARIEALQTLKTFLTRYAQARLAWLAGNRDTEFPPGTYLMAHRFGGRVAPAFS